MSCGLITIGSEPECDSIPVGGLSTRLVLINYSDVQAIYESEIGIVSIGLKFGKVAYEFFGFRNDVKKVEEVVGDINNRFRHAVSFVVYDVSQEQKRNIERLSRGRFIAIVENKGKTANAFELLGRECGLKMPPGQIRTSENGVFQINLATPDNSVELEPRLPQTVGESYEAGLEIIDEIVGSVSTGEGFDYEFDSEVE
jgi:hypothetical protein